MECGPGCGLNIVEQSFDFEEYMYELLWSACAMAAVKATIVAIVSCMIKVSSVSELIRWAFDFLFVW